MTANQLASRINKWIGGAEKISPNQIKGLIWALGTDEDLDVDFRGAVDDMRSDLMQEEIRLATDYDENGYED